MSKVKISIGPKIVLIIAAAVCAISGFLPWLSKGSYSANMGPVSIVFLLSGLVPLILSIIALITKTKGFNTASNVLGILGGAVALIYVLLFLGGSAMTGMSKYLDLGIGFWTALISGIAMVICSIISLAKNKSQNK